MTGTKSKDNSKLKKIGNNGLWAIAQHLICFNKPQRGDKEILINFVHTTPVTVNNNSPIQDYVHPDDQTQPTLELTSINSVVCVAATEKLARKG